MAEQKQLPSRLIPFCSDDKLIQPAESKQEVPVPTIVFIVGPSGSGKTTLATKLKTHYSDKCCIINFDNYYKDLSKVSPEELKNTNFDEPDAFDWDLFTEHLNRLHNNQPIPKVVYDYNTAGRTLTEESIKPTSIIIIEGLFLLCNPNVRRFADYIIYISKPEFDESFSRRLQRDKGKYTAKGIPKNQFALSAKKNIREGFLAHIFPYTQHANVHYENNKEQKDLQLQTIIEKIDEQQKKKTAHSLAYPTSNFFKKRDVVCHTLSQCLQNCFICFYRCLSCK